MRPVRSIAPKAAATIAIVGGALALGAPAAASASSITYSVNPSDVIAGRPSELRFVTDHPADSQLFVFVQSRTLPCAAKPALSVGKALVNNADLDPGRQTTNVVETYRTPQQLRVCGYVQPYESGRWTDGDTPLATGSWDLIVRGARTSFGVAGLPAAVAPGSEHDVTFTTTTETPSDVRYRLVPGATCPGTAAGPSVYDDGRTVTGGPEVVIRRVSLKGVPTGVYTWCGYSGNDVGANEIEQVVPLGSVSVGVPAAAPPAPVAATPGAQQPPSASCRVTTKRIKRGKALRVSCTRVTAKTIRIRFKRGRKTVTRTVPLKNGTARAGTTGMKTGTWKVSILTDAGKVGAGRVSVRRR